MLSSLKNKDWPHFQPVCNRFPLLDIHLNTHNCLAKPMACLTYSYSLDQKGKTTFLNDVHRSHKCIYIRQYHNARPYVFISKILELDPSKLPYWHFYEKEGMWIWSVNNHQFLLCGRMWSKVTDTSMHVEGNQHVLLMKNVMEWHLNWGLVHMDFFS